MKSGDEPSRNWRSILLRRVSDITPEMKKFMNDLWGAEGDFVDTPLGRGRIEDVRTKAGLDLAVTVSIPDVDGMTIFDGSVLFELEQSR